MLCLRPSGHELCRDVDARYIIIARKAVSFIGQGELPSNWDDLQHTGVLIIVLGPGVAHCAP